MESATSDPPVEPAPSNEENNETSNRKNDDQEAPASPPSKVGMAILKTTNKKEKSTINPNPSYNRRSWKFNGRRTVDAVDFTLLFDKVGVLATYFGDET